MSITITGDLVKRPEQIKKNLVTENYSETILNSIRRILEKDEFNFFNTKCKYLLEKKINFTNKKIEKLIELKMAGIKKGKELKKKFLELRKDNLKLIKSLNGQLGL